MKHLIKITLIAFSFLLLLISACKKDDPKTDDNNPGNTNKTCYVKSIKGSTSLDCRFFYSNNLKSRMELYFPNLGGEWEFDGALNFEYNANKQLSKLINRLSSSYTGTYELFYLNNRVSSFDVFDSSSNDPKEYVYTVKYDYNASGKISKWTAFEKSDPSAPFAEASLSYDNNGGIKEIIQLEPNGDGIMTPGIKYAFTNDNKNLVDPYFPALLLDEEILFLLFNQANMKQPKSLAYYSYDEAEETWVLEEELPFLNTYDVDGKLTKMIIEDELLNVAWDCK